MCFSVLFIAPTEWQKSLVLRVLAVKTVSEQRHTDNLSERLNLFFFFPVLFSFVVSILSSNAIKRASGQKR
jgi:hypothetical protein